MTEMVDQPARTLIVPTNQAFENLKEEVGCFYRAGGRGELFGFELSTTLLSGSSSSGGGPRFCTRGGGGALAEGGGLEYFSSMPSRSKAALTGSLLRWNPSKQCPLQQI